MSCVYVFDFGNMVKVGYTTELRERKKSVQHATKKKIERTFAIPAKIDVEQLAHAQLGKCRIKGEYYRCSFDQACEVVKAAKEELRDQSTTMPRNIPRYTLRVNQVLIDKLEYVARYNGRSKNKEIEMLIRQHIREFEAEHGKINLEDALE